MVPVALLCFWCAPVRLGVSTVSEMSVPAVVPRSSPSSAFGAEVRVPRRLPLPQLAALANSAATLHRIAAVDDHGRLAEQALVNALGWQAGQQLRIETLSTTALAITPDTDGLLPLARRGHLPLPAGVRRWCAIRPGDRVLLTAAPQRHLLLIHTMAALDAMITSFHTTTGGGASQ